MSDVATADHTLMMKIRRLALPMCTILKKIKSSMDKAQQRPLQDELDLNDSVHMIQERSEDLGLFDSDAYSDYRLTEKMTKRHYINWALPTFYISFSAFRFA